MSKFICMGLVCLLMLVVLWAPSAMAQSSETKTRPDATEASDQGNVSILEGPSSVGG